MNNYMQIFQSILRNNRDGFYDDIIKDLLVKIFDDCYLNRDNINYNIDNLFKKYDINMYNLLEKNIL